jgi:hypothetical protein
VGLQLPEEPIIKHAHAGILAAGICSAHLQAALL